MQWYSGRRSSTVDAKGDAERTRQDIAECRGMAVEVLAARGCCEKAGGRRDHGGRQCGRQVWRWKTSREAEDASGDGRHIRRWRTHLEAEDVSEGGRCIGRQKMHWKAEEVSEAEAESETERRGIRGFPLQLPPLQESIASMRACQNPLERTLRAS